MSRELNRFAKWWLRGFAAMYLGAFAINGLAHLYVGSDPQEPVLPTLDWVLAMVIASAVGAFFQIRSTNR